MITNRNLITSKSWDKKSRRRNQQKWINNDRQYNIDNKDNGNEDNNISQTMQLGVFCCTKYKSSPGYKTVYNSTILYFTALMMTGPEVLEDPKKNQINLQPEHNPMALNRIILNVLTKLAIDFGGKKNQQDENIDFRLIKYKACHVNKIFHIHSNG